MNLAIVGASGLVGRKMLEIVLERNISFSNLYFFASKRSAGELITAKNIDYTIIELTETSFTDYKIDFALFSAGGDTSKKYAPLAAKSGCVVIDNSSAWRMNSEVPLIVPEVNPLDALKHKNIIANPNCSTIQMVVALKPLHDAFKIKRIIVSTYQSVTGSGKKGLDHLMGEVNKTDFEKFYPHPIAYNVLPHIDVFLDDAYTKEEQKMKLETKKILGDDQIKVSATCVRVPTYGGHSESINVEFEKEFSLDAVYKLLSNAPGITVLDDLKTNTYPMPLIAHEKDDVFVGRIRRDETINNGLNLWVVSDNLRKGAATNAVQILELLLK
jgi:aspartate-semialdehyde dehydrogenase